MTPCSSTVGAFTAPVLQANVLSLLPAVLVARAFTAVSMSSALKGAASLVEAMVLLVTVTLTARRSTLALTPLALIRARSDSRRRKARPAPTGKCVRGASHVAAKPSVSSPTPRTAQRRALIESLIA